MSNEITTQNQTPVTQSERFTNKVLTEFGSAAGQIEVSNYQKQLIQGYFISIDRALKIAEENRIRKNSNNKDHKYDNNLPTTWENVNLNDLALDVVHNARLGLDMMQPNHISAIPFRNKKTNKYDIALMMGYVGKQYIAEKYALNKPIAVTTELVYDTDSFKPFKKSRENQVESYEFEIVNAFDRGKVVGGFGYLEFEDPKQNKLIIMTMKDIEKRKPKFAAAEFWGGTKKEWVNGKQQEVETDGWFEEMCLKTIKREVYSTKHITLDPKKIDDDYQRMKKRETQLNSPEVQYDLLDEEIEKHQATVLIDVDVETGEVSGPIEMDNPEVTNGPDF
ncbi:recombinational DNA repair protein (RecE pathway) [Alkalibaculum sp. M08DMB]|uniref:Recombinational DNA repair protein (RecE pathway) n=1 Tax=Alkalibaculum sporogenes TaxID=2655001 RepID=A0A6A7K9S1_9FIRM|nr:recombinase RecT [Alkalibaculum sporogenes]MPW26238.1 recombinational DNA repair protein (RecE pathway) [Alkalibaculum sporogenes]